MRFERFNGLIWLAAGALLVSCSSTPKPTNGNGDGKKVGDKTGDGVVKPTPVKVDPRTQMVKDLAALDFHKLGNPVLRWDHIPRVTAAKDRPHRLLVVLVEFADRRFDRYRKEKNQNLRLVKYYQEQLFDDTYKRKDTLSHYYYNQSGGQYHVTGTVVQPVTLSKKRVDYGGQTRPAGGSWRNDRDSEGMVEEALGLAFKANPGLDWKKYDQWDPQDYNKNRNLNEPDGYLDHFVLVFAGGGQSSCQLLTKISDVITPNSQMDVLKKLSKSQAECANRMWPHRFKIQKRESQGPKLAGGSNRIGGAPLSESLWIKDYNMQSEYIEASTFIHEFGHSLGLPDVYARTSSNSTGGWEVMSGTASPSPQNLSAWARLQLGWIKPTVIVPPEFGGKADGAINLRTLDDAPGDGASRALMVVLPPKQRKIELTSLLANGGSWALYSGQGNDMNRKATVALDFTGTKETRLELSFDAWWQIEGGWDFAYVETSIDGGTTWKRRVTADKKFMPAKHGHDGKTSLPGFTGLSGDFNGDGKNESVKECDPKKKLAHGEDKANAKKSPCKKSTWVRPMFDLSDLKGKKALVRLRYFTDGAAVENGILIDNVSVTGATVGGDFEAAVAASWKLEGFTRSKGNHDILVPHFYLVEYRDPYAAPIAGDHRYDSALAKAGFSFYYDPAKRKLKAIQVRTRPGVVAWYYNGAYAWSENDPSINGAGKGYVLAVDSNPNELLLPGFEKFFKGSAASFDTHYDIRSKEAQELLTWVYTRTVCFTRSRKYMESARDGIVKKLAPRGCGRNKGARAMRIKVDGKKLRYSYELINELLPGVARLPFKGIGEAIDTRKRKGKTSYRMRDRTLRNLHTRDSSFSLDSFADGIVYWEVSKNGRKLVKVGSKPYPAVSKFTDSTPGRWLNKKLPFGGVAVPNTGFSFELAKPGAGAKAGAKIQVKWAWPKKTGR